MTLPCVYGGQTGVLRRTLSGHTDAVIGAWILDDGNILSSSRDGTTRLWDYRLESAVATLDEHSGLINGVSVIEEEQVLSWSRDATLRLWDIHNGTQLKAFIGHTKSVSGAQVLDDGRILTWSEDKTLRLWNIRNAAQLTVLAGHTEEIDSAVYLENDRIVSGSRGTLIVWDGKTGIAIGSPLSEQEAHEKGLDGQADDYLAYEANIHCEFKYGKPFESFAGNCRVDPRGRAVVLSTWLSEEGSVVWQGFGSVCIHALLPAGTIVATINNQLLCLQLLSGARRISLREYENGRLNQACVLPFPPVSGR